MYNGIAATYDLKHKRLAKIHRAITFTVFLIAMIVIATFAGGCDTLRFAPSESQKQIAYDTFNAAQAVNATGATAGSAATKKLVNGTAATLTYTGVPDNPTIADYDTTLQTAQADSAKRPTIDDVANTFDGVMELGIGLAGVLGGTLGTKAIKALMLARQKAAALKEVVQGNEQFKTWLETTGNTEAVEAFRTAQTKVQEIPTEQVVFQIRSELPAAVSSVKSATAAATTTASVNRG